MGEFEQKAKFYYNSDCPRIPAEFEVLPMAINN
jgi:hypothetical protein